MTPDRPEGRRQGFPRAQQTIDPEAIARLFSTVQDLDDILNGNQRLGLPALRDVINRVEKELNLFKGQFTEIQKRLGEIQARQRSGRIMIWLLAIACSILLITVVILSLKLGGIF